MYHLFIATPEKVVFDDEVISLIAPGTVGYFEILTDHTPFISTLKTGKFVITDKNQKKLTWAVSGGYLEMSHNNATVLADTAELSSEIDVKRAEKSLKRAHERLESAHEELDLLRAKLALKRAENRLTIARETLQKL